MEKRDEQFTVINTLTEANSDINRQWNKTGFTGQQGIEDDVKNSPPFMIQESSGPSHDKSEVSLHEEKHRFSHVLEGEPQNPLPESPRKENKISKLPRYLITTEPKLHFCSGVVEAAHKNADNLRFNVGGPPAWEQRLARGDRPTRERRLLKRALVSLSTLEGPSRNLTKLASTTLTERDKLSKNSKFGLQTESRSPRKFMERGSVVNSLQGLSAKFCSGNFPHESNVPKLDSAGDFEVSYVLPRNPGNQNSKFRSTVIPSEGQGVKLRPAIHNHGEGKFSKYTSQDYIGNPEVGYFNVEEHSGQDRFRFSPSSRLPVTQSNPNFSVDQNQQSNFDWPYGSESLKTVNFEKLLKECQALDPYSFEQAEEFFLHHEETLNWIINTGNNLSILKDLMDCNNKFIGDYILKSLKGRLEPLTYSRYSMKVLRGLCMHRKHEDEAAELVISELENLLYTEKKHFFITSFIKKASNKVNTAILKKLMALFKQDKPQIRENIANLINDLISLVPQEEVNHLIATSCLNIEDVYYLPYSNFFIRNLLNSMNAENLAEVKEYTMKNLAKLCNHQKSSRIIELIFEYFGEQYCDSLLLSLLRSFFAECQKVESLGESGSEDFGPMYDSCRRELRQFRFIVSNQYGNFTLKSLFKNCSREFKSTYSKYIFRIKKYDGDLFSHYYASHFFNYFKKMSKEL